MWGMSLLFLIPGLGVTIYGFSKVKKAIDAKKWPKAKGKILRSAVYEKDGRSKASIRYSYVVSDVNYTGIKVGFMDGEYSSFWDWEGQSLIPYTYPKDADVEVYYDPENPKKCCLETNLKFSYFHMVFYGLTMFVPGVVLLVRMW